MFLAEIEIQERLKNIPAEKDEKQFRGTIHSLTKLGANSFPSNITEKKPRLSYQNIQRIARRRVRLCSPGVDGSGLGWESSRHQEMATVSSSYPPYRSSSRWGFNYAVSLNLASLFLKKAANTWTM